MARDHALSLVSAVLGALGTVALFVGGWSEEPYSGFAFGGNEANEHNMGVVDRNRRRARWRRIGLALLLLSFVAQGVAAAI